ncbi:MAG: ABC transporter permease [Christensenellales bacterium]|jgi:ribose transport system permease protein
MQEQLKQHELRMRRNIKRAQAFETIGKFWTLAVFLIIVTSFSLFQPRMLSLDYWKSTFSYMTEIIILGIGEGMVMIGGCIDLSIGALSGLVGVISAITIKGLVPVVGVGWAIVMGIAMGLATGVLMGFINGLIVSRMKLSPFLATIGTMGACAGLSLVFSRGTEVAGLPRVLGTFANYKIVDFVTPNILVGWAILLVFIFILHKTRFGLHTYAVGSSHEALTRSGVDADRHITRLYMISGLMGAFSGILLMMRFVSASPLTGSTSQLTAVAAAAIGGVSSRGGVGRAEGILLGALIISVVMTGLVLINVPTYWQQVAVGVIIVLSVYMDQFSSRAQLR